MSEELKPCPLCGDKMELTYPIFNTQEIDKDNSRVQHRHISKCPLSGLSLDAFQWQEHLSRTPQPPEAQERTSGAELIRDTAVRTRAELTSDFDYRVMFNHAKSLESLLYTTQAENERLRGEMGEIKESVKSAYALLEENATDRADWNGWQDVAQKISDGFNKGMEIIRTIATHPTQPESEGA